jgi:DNA-binding MarR family transcriptional regulator
VPGDGAESCSKGGRRGRREEAGDGGFLRLLRDSHIFASAIREFLDVRLLREISTEPLTPSQFHILKLMSLNGLRQVGEVANLLGVSSPAATKNIDKLERLGLVARSRSQGDRRATLLSVSRKGRRLVRKYDDLRVTCFSPMLEGFKPSEIKQLTKLLERLSSALVARSPSGERFCLRCAGYIEDECPVGRIRGGCRYHEIRSGRANNKIADDVS